MNKLLESIDLAKELYKYGVLNENKFIEDKSLSLLTSLSLLENESSFDKDNKNSIENEIVRVKRKVPKWFSKPTQYNSRILLSYMKLSKCNQVSIEINKLMDFTGIEEKIFFGHYNNMKIISEKNHAKVFEEDNKRVLLWEPISNFVSSYYREDAFRKWAKSEGKMTNENVVEQYINTLKIKIPKLLEEKSSEIQYENLFLCEDINILEELHLKFLKDGEWHEEKHSTYPSSIKKYIDYLAKC